MKVKLWLGAILMALVGVEALIVGNPANARPMGNPLVQYGRVHSCPPPYGTNGIANVSTTDGGYDWYAGGRPVGTLQYGVVHSDTTGGNANVLTMDGGNLWQFHDNGGPLYCSPP